METREIAQHMVATKKGILAADESNPTIKKRLATIDVESSEETRNSYRELLFTTDGLEEHISCAILFDQTLRSSVKDGTPFPEVLKNKGIIPGIKVDKGLVELPRSYGEKFTQGLDGLKDRLTEYYELGARFTKWRAVITIGDAIPTSRCIDVNANFLAMYASLAQDAGLVPIVEPEVLMNGSHDIDRCEEVTRATLQSVFFHLYIHKVDIESMILKPNMIISGLKCPVQANSNQVAEATLRCFKQVLPAALPGVAFLSGGQSSIVATENLNAINQMGKNLPWKLTFSFGRALQNQALKTWQGKAENIQESQKKLYLRAKCNGMASVGEYSSDMEATS
jgi:fructose-bisphosphate aldolase class I